MSQLKLFLSTQLGIYDAHLMPLHFHGTETLSQPYCFEIHFLSRDVQIDSAKLLGYSATLRIHQAIDTGKPMLFNGIVSRLERGLKDDAKVTRYSMTLVPWFVLLDDDHQKRIFQNKTVIEIFIEICRQHDFMDYDLSAIHKQHPKTAYCVQYHETSMAFLQRLLADAGIIYYFRHKKRRHVLVLIDDPHGLPSYPTPILYHKVKFNQAHLHQWRVNHVMHTTQLSSSNHRTLTPFKPVQATIKTQQQSMPHLLKQLHFPDEQQNKTQAYDRVKQGMRIIEWQSNTIDAAGDVVDLHAGTQFQNAYQQRFNIVSIKHEVSAGHYCNQFKCVSTRFPYQAPLLEKPPITGCHLAKVTGPIDETVYRDAFGRIKVQFSWDRQGKNDENSSCWLRVAQHSAGNNYGHVFIPRIGMEVVVSYLYGDPDRPEINGCLYNSTHIPPFKLPQERYKSGITTQTLSSDDATQGNAFIMDDTPEHEKLVLQAQKDFQLISPHDQHTTVMQNMESTIGANQCISAKGKVEITAKHGITLQAGDSCLEISADKICLKGNRIDLGADGFEK